MFGKRQLPPPHPKCEQMESTYPTFTSSRLYSSDV